MARRIYTATILDDADDVIDELIVTINGDSHDDANDDDELCGIIDEYFADEISEVDCYAAIMRHSIH